MQCPSCDEVRSRVVESRDLDAGSAIRRRRECLDCKKRFTTYERIERPQIIVIKSDGTRQRFDRNKLIKGITTACEKRPITALQIDDVVSGIENELYASGESEIRSSEIGELTTRSLRSLDEIAYVRFASVYRSFKDLESFEQELRRLRDT